jgi:hypothetical protein
MRFVNSASRPYVVAGSRITMPATDRNVAVLGASLFGLALSEELWQAYMPAYVTAPGASGVIVGLFGPTKDLLDRATDAVEHPICGRRLYWNARK